MKKASASEKQRAALPAPYRVQELSGSLPADLIKAIDGLGGTVFQVWPLGNHAERLRSEDRFHGLFVWYGDELVALKLGYPEAPDVFYSWIGAVGPAHRRQGIADLLMQRQHDWCRKQGFRRIRSKTKNAFKAMLILNLRHGFNIVSTYTDRQGEIKIVLEKVLS